MAMGMGAKDMAMGMASGMNMTTLYRLCEVKLQRERRPATWSGRGRNARR